MLTLIATSFKKTAVAIYLRSVFKKYGSLNQNIGKHSLMI
jgi:hypothetical protein